MFPLLLLVLGLGAVLTAYEFSPRARSRLDAYARALREAHAAHQEADSHLANTQAATRTIAPVLPVSQEAPTPPIQVPPPAGEPPPAQAPSPLMTEVSDVFMHAVRAAAEAVDHAIAATASNQQAAQSTAEAAAHAQTAAERGAAAASADKVLERAKKISAALASLGVGQCGVRTYAGVTPQVRDKILAELHAEGMTVTGDNPWDIDTQVADVKLRAVWDPRGQVLRLIVTASAVYAPCGVIWGRIDPKLRSIIGT